MHYTFRTYAWDLGIITQSLWTTLNSDKILYSTLEVPYGNPTGNFMGVHFSPILFFILPIYAMYQTPETLLVFQSFILAIAALPLYWIAKDKLGKKTYALAFSLTYLLNPSLHGVNTYDFHLEIFTPLFILFAFYYIEKGKWLKAIPFLFLELTTLEFAPLIVFSLGFYFFIKNLKRSVLKSQDRMKVVKRVTPHIILMLISIFSFYLAIYVIQSINPLKRGGAPGKWEYWGSSVFEIPVNILKNPNEAIIRMVTPIEKPYFIIFLFAIVLFLPIFAPIELLLSFSWLIPALLTDYPPYYQPCYQYTAFILGQIFIAAIYGFSNFFSSLKAKEHNKLEQKTILAILITSLLLLATFSPIGIPAFTNRSVRPYSISTVFEIDHIEKLYSAINLIPTNASIATTWDIFPHVCQRLHAYVLKWPMDYPVEYILVDLKSPCLKMGIYGPTPNKIINLVNGEYGIVASLDGILLLKRYYDGPVKYYAPQKDVFNYNHLVPGSARIIWDYTGIFRKVICSDLENSVGVIWFGPYKYFAPGSYKATFRLKIANKTYSLLLDVTSDLGTTILSNRTINAGEFKQLNTWQDFSLYFELSQPTELEFRGWSFFNNTYVALDYVNVTQLGP